MTKTRRSIPAIGKLFTFKTGEYNNELIMTMNPPKPIMEWKAVPVTEGRSPVQKIAQKSKIPPTTDPLIKEIIYAVLHQDNYEDYDVDDVIKSITHLAHPTKKLYGDNKTSRKLNTNPDTTNETIPTKKLSTN